MDKTIEIRNDFLTVEISALGAEIVRIKDKDGNDRQWNGDPSVWSGRAPIMFPICGGLKNDTLKFGEKEYQLKKHGFAKLMSFECEKAEKDSAVFCFVQMMKQKSIIPLILKCEQRSDFAITALKLLTALKIRPTVKSSFRSAVTKHMPARTESKITA